MDVDLPEVHAQALDMTRQLVAGVSERQWDDTSVCEDWTVRELVNHIVTGNYWAEELGSGKSIEEVGDRLDGDVLGDDPVRAYDDSAARAAAVFRAPGAMDAPCAVSYGPVPGSVYCGHRFLDVLVHGWDVAKSTGQDTTLDPDARRSMLGGGRAPARDARSERRVRDEGGRARRRGRGDESFSQCWAGTRDLLGSHDGSVHHRVRASGRVAVGAHLQPQPLDHRYGDREVRVRRRRQGRSSP